MIICGGALGRKKGEGAHSTMPVHHIDELAWMVGIPTEILATMSNVAHDNSEVEYLSMEFLRFANGSVGQLTSPVVHYGQKQHLIFQCERA